MKKAVRIEDVLNVQREISYVRGNIDRIGITKGDDWDGKFTKYYENGNIEQEVIWVGGCPEEITDYDEDGNKI